MAVRGAVDDPRRRWRVRLHLSAAEDLRGDLPDRDRVERAAGSAGRRTPSSWAPGPLCAAKEFYETQYRIIQSTRGCAEGGRQARARARPRLRALRGATARRRHAEPGARTRRARSRSNRSRIPASPRSSFGTTSRERAALLANAFAETYIEFNLDYKLEGSRAANAWLSEQEVELRKKLEDSELALFKFKKDRGLLDINLGDKQNMSEQILQTLNGKLAEIRMQAHRARSRRASMVEAARDQSDKESVPAVEGNGWAPAHARELPELSPRRRRT